VRDHQPAPGQQAEPPTVPTPPVDLPDADPLIDPDSTRKL
jgi:hypothetical protein